MNERPVKLGFVGCGNQGQNAHIRRYYRLKDRCELVALAEIRPNLAKKVALAYGFKEIYSSHRELIQKADVDAYVCIQHYNRHLNIVPELLATGKPVLTEKPIAFSVEAAKSILKANRKSGGVYMVGYQKRCDLASIYAKNLMRQWQKTQECGGFSYIRVTMPPGDWVAGGNYAIVSKESPDFKIDPSLIEKEPAVSYFSESQWDKYNIMVNYYSHQIDLLRFFLEEKFDIEYADKNMKIMAIKGEKTGRTGLLEMDIYKQSIDWEEKVLICFEKGYMEINPAPPLADNRCGTVKVYKENENPEYLYPSFPHEDPMTTQAKCFLKAVRGEIKPPCTPKEALDTLKVCKRYVQSYVK